LQRIKKLDGADFMNENYFQLKQRQTNVRTEVLAGITTFLTMAYIIFANPAILSNGTDMDKGALIAVTCLVTAIATLITALYANAPIAMAPGMGLNAFFAYLVVSGKMDWQTGLGVVFISGLLFFILTIAGLRKKIVEAIPLSLISAIAVGIGLFITFIGLQKLGIVVSDKITLVKAAPLNKTILIGLFGLVVMLTFEMKKISGGLVAGILASTILAIFFDKNVFWPKQIISMDFNITPVAFKLNIFGALKWSLAGSILTFMFMDLFDSIGTLVACCQQAKLVDKQNRIIGLGRLLGIDAAASMIGAVFGTSTTTSYVESAAGIEQGGRTGLTSVVTAGCFVLAMLFVPIVEIVPDYATAPALIMVGLFMAKEIRNINITSIEEGFPSFIIMVMIALSYSISTGIAFGFISYTLIKIVKGKVSEIKLTMWIITILCIAFLMLEEISQLLK
jgi:AGZA family xanthine/uracil permease-like MFS transporter